MIRALPNVGWINTVYSVANRTFRLAANIHFIRHNLCPLSFTDVPQQRCVDAMIGVDGLNRIELLRYQLALSEVVAAIVRSDGADTDATVSARSHPCSTSASNY